MIQSLIDVKKYGANDGYESSNFYFDRAMDQRAGLRIGGHLPSGRNRRRLVHSRIPEPGNRRGRDRGVSAPAMDSATPGAQTPTPAQMQKMADTQAAPL